jgi:hypothetical protein
MGLVADWPLGSPIWAVQSPTIRITWCPNSWSKRRIYNIEIYAYINIVKARYSIFE